MRLDKPRILPLDPDRANPDQAAVLAPLGHTANVWIETISLMGHIGVMLAFLLIVLHSKHLHIGAAPVNVYGGFRQGIIPPTATNGSTGFLMKMLGDIAPVLDRAGRGAWRDMWRVAPPLAALASVLSPFRPRNRTR